MMTLRTVKGRKSSMLMLMETGITRPSRQQLQPNNKPSHPPTTLPWPGYCGQPPHLNSLSRRAAAAAAGAPELRRRRRRRSPDSAASASKPFLIPLLLFLLPLTSHCPTLSRLPHLATVCSRTPLPSWLPPAPVHPAVQQEGQPASHSAPGQGVEPPGPS